MGIRVWLHQLLFGWTSLIGRQAETAPLSTADGPVWCVAANVLNDRPYGPGGAEVRHGTKHFAPGAKVYVVDFFWGMGGDRVTVVGRHRKSKRYTRLVMRADHLANWRAELVYSPHVVKQVLASGEFAELPRGGSESRARAEEIVAIYLRGGAVSQPFTTRPPSAEPDSASESFGT